MTDDDRITLRNTDCLHCKYAYNRHCRIDNMIRLCSTCEHRAKQKNSLGFDCLCVLKPTKIELKTGKCKYFVRADDDDNS
uniref:Uncharacterized protein n=1 Tax=Podoviridae sp. ctaNW81 TaxID=2826562 RepID=A0A8S5M5H7_9CAUD|nr:MAG TPA: hypothetical protein [Podoviridae sp. ctaNW81]